MVDDYPLPKLALYEQTVGWFGTLFVRPAPGASIAPDYYREFLAHSEPVNAEDLLRLP